MDEYIRREDAKELLIIALDDDWETEYAENRMDEISSADVRENVHGEWIIRKYSDFADCSVCNEPLRLECGIQLFDELPNFCPNCGADMKAGRRMNSYAEEGE